MAGFPIISNLPSFWRLFSHFPRFELITTHAARSTHPSPAAQCPAERKPQPKLQAGRNQSKSKQSRIVFWQKAVLQLQLPPPPPTPVCSFPLSCSTVFSCFCILCCVVLVLGVACCRPNPKQWMCDMRSCSCRQLAVIAAWNEITVARTAALFVAFGLCLAQIDGALVAFRLVHCH